MFENKKIFWLFIIQFLSNEVSARLLLKMPNVRPKVETNLCRAFAINTTTYITGFQPEVKSSDQAHHMIIYACDIPGKFDRVWDCGEMSDGEGQSSYESAPVCEDERIIYAWAMEAPALDLPKDVSFKVGGKKGPLFVVLQVHYKDVSVFRNKGQSDSSGVILKTSTKPTNKTAGVYLIYSELGLIPPGATDLKASCVYEESPLLHPFAFRVHAHKHGVEITGKLTKDKHTKIIGQRSPQLPQMFQKIEDSSMTIEKGDKLSVNCRMKNDEEKTYYIGPTASDEMCNFYVMYWVDGGRLPNSFLCPEPVEEVKGQMRMSELEREIAREHRKLSRLFEGDGFGEDFEDPTDMNENFDISSWLEGLRRGRQRKGPPFVHAEFESKSVQASYENGEQKYFNQNSEHNKFTNDEE